MENGEKVVKLVNDGNTATTRVDAMVTGACLPFKT